MFGHLVSIKQPFKGRNLNKTALNTLRDDEGVVIRCLNDQVIFFILDIIIDNRQFKLIEN